MVNFDNFAGQLVTDGIRPLEPAIELEGTASAAYVANLQTMHGLMAKIGKTVIHETRIMQNPLEDLFAKYTLPYGVGVEHAEFLTGTPNKKYDGTCVPRGTSDMASQICLINAAYSIDVSIYDREINKEVLTPEESGQFVAQKMRLPLKTLSTMRYAAMRQIVSDVIDGTRAITSTTESDGSGTSVSYAPTVSGYAGVVDNTSIVLPSLTQGTIPAFASMSDMLDMLWALENAAVEMREEGTVYSALGISTLTLGRPVCIMESKILNAMDNAIMDGASQRIPTRTAREFIGTFADVVEIGSFADLPTNATYSGSRLAAVLLDRDSCYEHVQYADVEAQRCAKGRFTGYNFAGASAISIYRGNPAYALLTQES